MNINTAFSQPYSGFSDINIGERLLLQAKEQLALYRLKLQVSKERRELADLPDHLLADMGIERADVLREAQREFSDIPLERIVKR